MPKLHSHNFSTCFPRRSSTSGILLRLGRCRQGKLVILTELAAQLAPVPFAFSDPLAIYRAAAEQLIKSPRAEFNVYIDQSEAEFIWQQAFNLFGVI